MTPTVAVPPVSDDERFFRRLLPDRNHFALDSSGAFRVSSQGFADRQFEPSVDRELLCEELGGAAFTQQNPANCVVSVTQADVQAVRFDHGQKPPKQVFTAGLSYCPLTEYPENPAHYVVQLQPTSKSARVFKKLAERLARRAQLVLAPVEIGSA